LFVGKICPIDNIAQDTVGSNTNELAGFVVHAAIVAHIADFDRSFEEQQPGHSACLNINIEDGATNRD